MVATLQSREPVVARLGALIGTEKTGLVPPCIFVHGPKSSGKTWIVSRFLRTNAIAHAMIPSQFCHFSKDFLDYITREIWTVVGKMTKKPKRKTAEEEPPQKTQNGEELLGLQKQLDIFTLDGPKFCLVFDDAEFFLFHKKRDMLATFMALQELTSRNVCVVLISSSPWERFLHKKLPCVPFTLSVPQFDLDSALEVLSSTVRRSRVLSKEIFDPVMRNIVKAVFPVTRNISDIKLMVESVLEACHEKLTGLQVEMEEANEMGSSSGMKSSELILFKSFQIAAPFIKEAVKRVHLREVRQSEGASDLDLPVFARYLLIAAFIASYNSPKWDKIYFAKKHNEGNRKTKFAADRKYSETTGPQFFPQTRLLYIFRVIYETAHPDDTKEPLRRFCVLRPLVTTLERSGLLSRGSQDLLFNPKYKCIASARLVMDVAKNVNFQLGMYVKNLAKL